MNIFLVFMLKINKYFEWNRYYEIHLDVVDDHFNGRIVGPFQFPDGDPGANQERPSRRYGIWGSYSFVTWKLIFF